jgi:hypothetical protein
MAEMDIIIVCLGVILLTLVMIGAKLSEIKDILEDK